MAQIKQEGEVPGILDLAMRGPAPKIYFNNATLVFSASDVSLVLQHNGIAVGVVNASFSTIKSVAKAILEGVGEIERVSGMAILTTDEMGAKLKAQTPHD